MVTLQGVSSVFNWVILSSLMGSILIFLILGLKFIFKNKMGANWQYYIWFLLLLRLIIPFTPESPLSMYNLIKVGSFETILSEQVDSFVPANNPLSQAGDATSILGTDANTSLALKSAPVVTSDEVINRRTILILLWMIGTILLAGYTVFINLKLWYQIKNDPKINNSSIIYTLEVCKSEMGIFHSIPLVTTNKIRTPALFGLINSTLLLPNSIIKNLTDDELKYIILHELAHWKRKDIIINWITVILQILHWFNPVIWYGFYRMHQDCELACDALVLSSLNPEKRKAYGHTIIRVLEMTFIPQWIPGTTRMLTGKSHIKRRIGMISNYKRGSLSISIAAVVIVVVVGLIGCTNAQNADVLPSKVDIDKGSYNQMLLDLKNNQMLAGTVDVEGPGIVVTLSDANTFSDGSPGLLVHDSDIRMIIDELIVAEAEAISVNDERLIATSAIACKGNSIQINNNPYPSPFIIKAIGNSEKMVKALEAKGGPTGFYREIGLGITIEKSDMLSIPKYNGEAAFKYAKPVGNHTD
ncbi:M56 family metallopeptidase [Syntrophomonas erecta subsp. sporosyntropha]